MGCRKYQGWIAAGIYEPLTADEQRDLEAHLSACRRCSEDAATLRAFSAALPVDPVVFTGDLLPALRARIADEPRGAWWARWHWGRPAAALMTVAVIAGAIAWQRPVYAPAPAAPVQVAAVTAPTEAIPASPVAAALEEADALVARRNYAGALGVLKEAVAAYPEAPEAGQAQLRVASLEFNQLRRYPYAYAEYEKLIQAYPEVYQNSPESIENFEVLAEVQKDKFDPLFALDAARSAGGDTFAQLERVLAHYPGGYVAARAVEEMAQLAAEELGPQSSYVAALDTVRSRCSDPVAVAQLQLALGDTYYREMQNPARAQELYQTVAQSESPILAQLAQDALVRIQR
ncbi:MAG: zf-HC2 domain-containing protein [Candidatus Hydrogenedentes bacterium]|nr:zf-HC2 domain-containing protein [Candidatus Hydrogenedentota bacterium]